MRVLIFLAICSITACRHPSNTPETPPLTVRFSTELREQPDEKSRTICRLPVKTVLADQTETSRFLAAVFLNDSLHQEPWLRVQAPDGQSGWVFAGAVFPADFTTDAARRWLLGKRTQSLFGSEIAQRLWAWSEGEIPATDTAFAAHLRAGLHLRDTLNQLLANAVSRGAAQAPVDLSWLSKPMLYFWLQPGASPQLYLDYRRVAQVAARTAGTQDDQFAAFGFAAYPLDSVESALPAWVFPLSLEESCSNLGAGHHLNVLQRIEKMIQSGSRFRPELLRLKDQILADILDNSRTYWQSGEKILSELDQIVAARFTCLTARDRLALEARRAMFVAGEVRMDLRSGR